MEAEERDRTAARRGGVALPALVVGVLAGVVWFVATQPLLGSPHGVSVTGALLTVSVAGNAALGYAATRLSRRGGS